MSYCENFYTSVVQGINGEVQLAVCEVYYWVNKTANSSFPYAPFSESYNYSEVQSVIENYIDGVINNFIPEWQDPKNNTIENKIIQYLVKKSKTVKSPIEPRIRAIFATLVKSEKGFESSRTRINPCVLFPKSENCKDTERSLAYQRWKADNDKTSLTSPIQDVSNLLQSITILAVVGGLAYLTVKFGALKK